MRMFPAVLALVAIPACSGVAACPAKRSNIKEISVEQLWARLQSGAETHVFDANTEARFAEGHVPKAQWVVFNAVHAKDLPADKQAMLVFYCGNEMCQASHGAASMAIDLGHPNVYVMPSGIIG